MATEKDKWLPFTNDFIFSMVMRDADICKGLLERIIPEEDFSEIVLSPQDHPLFSDGEFTLEQQKNMKFGPEIHGVRFDAFIKSSEMWVEIEMQTYNDRCIGKRSRYYHANMDMDFLESGRPYKALKKSYVIFICTYDYLKKDEAIYVFQNYDIEHNVPLNDDRYTILLNTSCSREKTPDSLKPLYTYLNDHHQINGDSFIEKLDSLVRKYNTPEWRQRQMTLEHLINQAEEKGMERVNKLAELLLEAGRIEDLRKSIKDPEYQKQLMKEFDI